MGQDENMIYLLAMSLLLAAAPTGTKKAELLQLEKMQKIQASSTAPQETRSMMIIEPKERANDYLKAFDMLKQEKSSAKVYFEIAGGMKITNVIDMKLMPNNTLILFRYSTPGGIKFQVVEVEDILGIHHL